MKKFLLCLNRFNSPGAALLLSACVFAGIPACKKAPPAGGKPPRSVIVEQSVLGDSIEYIDEIGRCVAYERVMVRPQVSGPIVGIHFTDGADVKKGDLLFTIDSRPFQAKLDQVSAFLAQEKAKASFDLAQLARNQKLIERQVVSAQDLDSARSAEKSSQALMQAAQAALEQAKIDIDYCSIRSPIDGRAGKRLVDSGNIVTANTTNLLEIQRQDPIYAEFTIPENQLCKVRDFIARGTLSVVVSMPELPDRARKGKLDFLDSGVKSDSGTVLLRAVLENSDRMFWPGQFVQVRIVLDTVKDSVLIPADAVQTGVDTPFVFVVGPEETASVRNIKVGQKQGDKIVVTEGLADGETVVVFGQLGLSKGAKVKIVEKKAAEKP